MITEFFEKEFEKNDKKVAQIERAIERVERARDKADRKAEAKELRRFEKLADREMRGTKRDFN